MRFIFYQSVMYKLTVTFKHKIATNLIPQYKSKNNCGYKEIVPYFYIIHIVLMSGTVTKWV